jgi:hypothetical protein
MGFNRRMPRCIRYGPKTLGGLSLKTVRVEQGLKHILLLLDHTRRNDDIGKHIHISLEITQFETGLEFPFYEAINKPRNCHVHDLHCRGSEPYCMLWYQESLCAAFHYDDAPV